jgi:ubiquinone/menaquinone biosynthesis C-methylase UbiE
VLVAANATIGKEKLPGLVYKMQVQYSSNVYKVDPANLHKTIERTRSTLASSEEPVAKVEWAIRVVCDFDELEAFRTNTTDTPVAIHPKTFALMPEADRAEYYKPPRLAAFVPFPDGARRCFLISPIGAVGSAIRRDADDVLEHYVKPACGLCGYRPVRGDDQSGLKISNDIVNAISSDPLVLAYVGDGVSGWNPNVMLEIGWRLGVGSSIGFLQRGGTNPPFDLTDYRFVRIQEPRDEENAARVVDDLVSKMKASDRTAGQSAGGKDDPTAYSHAIARIDIPDNGSEKSIFVAESEEAAELFRVQRGQERDLREVMADLIARLSELQRDDFLAEQEDLTRKLKQGGIPVAKRPIVFKGHDSPTSPQLAHLPIILQRTPLAGKTRLRDLYLDVTNAARQTTKESYLCELGLESTRWLELLKGLRQPPDRDESDVTQQAFDAYAAGYDAILPQLSFYMEVVNRHKEALLQPEISRIADLGAGTGSVTVPLLLADKEVVAVDTSSAMLARLRKKLRAKSMQHADRLTIAEHSVERLGELLSDGWFDGVNLLLVLYSVVEPERGLAEALRILRPGGRIVLTEPKRQFDLARLLEIAEDMLKNLAGWSELREEWKIVRKANEVLDPKQAKDLHSRLYVEDIEDRLRQAGFTIESITDSHYKNCATIVAVKPR